MPGLVKRNYDHGIIVLFFQDIKYHFSSLSAERGYASDDGWMRIYR